MKTLIWITLLISNLFAIPSWYINRDYRLPEINEVVGYGEGDTVAMAIMTAKTDISEQLFTSVSSTVLSKTEEYSSTGRVSTSSTKRMSSSSQMSDSQIVLEESQIIKQQTEDGKWFVAVLYENMTTIDRFVRKVDKKYPNRKTKPSTNFFSKTRLGKEVAYELGTEPEIVFHDNIWKLKYKDVYQNIYNFDISDLFVDFNTKPMSFKKIDQYGYPSDSILYTGQRYKFEFDTGYRYNSLYYIITNGSVHMMMDNKPDGTITEDYDIAYGKGIDRPVMYVLVQSNEKIDNSMFKQLVGGEKYEDFRVHSRNQLSDFLKFLNGKNYSAKKVFVICRKEGEI
jgi:hypothetical protein